MVLLLKSLFSGQGCIGKKDFLSYVVSRRFQDIPGKARFHDPASGHYQDLIRQLTQDFHIMRDANKPHSAFTF
jgi:hypothetical protein